MPKQRVELYYWNELVAVRVDQQTHRTQLVINHPARQISIGLRQSRFIC